MTGPGVPLAEWKRELRAERAAVRDKLTVEQRSSWSSRICSLAWQWFRGEGASAMLAYVPFRSEVDTRLLIEECWAGGNMVLLPRVIRSGGMMSLHAVSSWEELAPGAYGILEPAAASTGHTEQDLMPEVVFVPGLAFDIKGGRLGYGAGYYDRMRAAWEGRYPLKPPLWVGLAYGVQLLTEVPMDDHDAYMDMLITEDGIIHCRKEK
ncbi:5-formyltetrahydrofolate cyclo-ligase [Paenibacillus sp. PK3_47]|uniref:5-formyltetrahydrofolate cyclo-ligase n=1 Tax=Paenibacillus sp. PK3_47 TaxID=2072642 RepID=UPI00201E59E1|nr:5-formyltetrahydrofolate cyclo-ligase [Paenibacillus sp. PK3_47]